MSPPGKEESGCNSRTNNNVSNVCNPAASSPPHDGLNASPSAPVMNELDANERSSEMTLSLLLSFRCKCVKYNVLLSKTITQEKERVANAEKFPQTEAVEAIRAGEEARTTFRTREGTKVRRLIMMILHPLNQGWETPRGFRRDSRTIEIALSGWTTASREQRFEIREKVVGIYGKVRFSLPWNFSPRTCCPPCSVWFPSWTGLPWKLWKWLLGEGWMSSCPTRRTDEWIAFFALNCVHVKCQWIECCNCNRMECILLSVKMIVLSSHSSSWYMAIITWLIQRKTNNN